MWVFTTIGFFSIVAHRDRPDFVLVRARVKADLSALVKLLPLPRPKVQRTPRADYLFRVVVGKQAMARVLAQLTEAIDYDNFKDAVADVQGVARAKVYHDVWHALLPLQQPKLAIVKPKPARRGSGLLVFDYDASVIGEVKAEIAIETDAGMMPDPDELPEFKPSDYATEADATAALRARMGEAQFKRFEDQSYGRDIRCFDKDGKEI